MTVSAATGPLLVAAALLALAGAAKVRRPAPTALALAQAGAPVPDRAVRALGGVEVTVALAAVVLGGRPAALAVALLYAAFAAFAAGQVARSRRGGTAADCGCFGTPAPATGTHVLVNLGLAALAGWAVAVPTPALVDLPAGTPAAGVPLAVLVAAATAGGRALLVELPVVRAAAARGAR